MIQALVIFFYTFHMQSVSEGNQKENKRELKASCKGNLNNQSNGVARPESLLVVLSLCIKV